MEFSKEQKRAIYTDKPRVIVAAGSGSGKTLVLIERLKYLLEKGISPKNIYAITYTNAAAEEMTKRLGEKGKQMFVGTIHSLANQILQMNSVNTSQIIANEEYDKLFEMVEEENIRFPEVDYLLVDEFQDICENEYHFMFDLLKPKQFFVVGDSRQCQPANTKVRLRNNVYKNIEDIEVGDSIVWYDRGQHSASASMTNFWEKDEKVVEAISSRDFCNDNLITIVTENGETSQYTPNHRTFVKLNKVEHTYVVCLISDRGYKFKTIITPFYDDRTHMSPWVNKMRSEGYNKIWILESFSTFKEAEEFESRLNNNYNFEVIESAHACLEHFNRNVQYPLLDVLYIEVLFMNFFSDRIAETYACNIMPELMSCVVYDDTIENRQRYEKIIEVNFNYITAPIKVYSLQVQGGAYVADNIITHNSIFSFKGANYKFFMDFVNDPFTEIYELCDNYRCGDDIIDFSNEIIGKVTDIYRTKVNGKSGIRGEVDVQPISYSALINTIQSMGSYKDWFVLTRTNAEIDTLSSVFERNNIPFITFKKSDKSLEELEKDVNKDSVKLLTIHCAKGLESRFVAVVSPKAWNDEEKRISYVAATRAKEYLLWMTGAKKKKISTTTNMIKW